MVFKTEKQILEKFKRLLFFITAVAILVLVYFNLTAISITLIAVCFVAEKYLKTYFKSLSLEITPDRIILKKGIIIKTDYFIARSRAIQVYKFRTFKTNLLVIKGTGFYLPLFPCTDFRVNEILEELL